MLIKNYKKIELHPNKIKSLFSLICILLTHGLLIIVPFNPPIKGLFDPKSPILLATYLIKLKIIFFKLRSYR